MWPGMQLQRLTTREPDLAQLAVAIAALEAVLAVENPRRGHATRTRSAWRSWPKAPKAPLGWRAKGGDVLRTPTSGYAAYGPSASWRQ